MKKLLFIFSPIFIFIFVLITNIAYAAPAQWGLAINSQTKECAGYWGGDENEQYNLPAGWKAYGSGSADYESYLYNGDRLCDLGLKRYSGEPGYTNESTGLTVEEAKTCCKKMNYDFIFEDFSNRSYFFKYGSFYEEVHNFIQNARSDDTETWEEKANRFLNEDNRREIQQEINKVIKDAYDDIYKEIPEDRRSNIPISSMDHIYPTDRFLYKDFSKKLDEYRNLKDWQYFYISTSTKQCTVVANFERRWVENYKYEPMHLFIPDDWKESWVEHDLKNEVITTEFGECKFNRGEEDKCCKELGLTYVASNIGRGRDAGIVPQSIMYFNDVARPYLWKIINDSFGNLTWFIVGIAIVFIIILVIIFILKKKKLIATSTTFSSLSIAPLEDYVKTAKSSGMTKDQIRQALLTAGWVNDDIDRVLKCMKKRMWILIFILFFLLIAVLLSFWPKEKIISQSARYYDSENDTIGEKKTIIQSGDYQVGDEVNYLKKWLADNQFISDNYFDSNFKNFKIEGNPSLTVAEVYNFDVFELSSYYDEKKNVSLKKRNICDMSNMGNCVLTIRKEGNKTILDNLHIGTQTFLNIDVGSNTDKTIECKKDNFHDCINEAIYYFAPNLRDFDYCIKPGGCISKEDITQYSVIGIEGLVNLFENIRLTKAIKPERTLRFDVFLNGENTCSGCYTSDGFGSYSASFEVDGSKLKIVGLSAPLKEYQLKINKAQASKIFKADKDCKNFNKIYLYADDGYWYPDTLEYEKYGLHWQVNSGDGYCGRECIIDATNGQLLKGENHCV